MSLANLATLFFCIAGLFVFFKFGWRSFRSKILLGLFVSCAIVGAVLTFSQNSNEKLSKKGFTGSKKNVQPPRRNTNPNNPTVKKFSNMNHCLKHRYFSPTGRLSFYNNCKQSVDVRICYNSAAKDAFFKAVGSWTRSKLKCDWYQRRRGYIGDIYVASANTALIGQLLSSGKISILSCLSEHRIGIVSKVDGCWAK